jgi:peptidoglycan/xylan/chitin deacetylase (PgdA/CDA1 family)
MKIIILVLFLLTVIIYLQFNFFTDIISYFNPYIIFRVTNIKSKYIAITIDDIKFDESSYFESIINILRKYNVQATFFINPIKKLSIKNDIILKRAINDNLIELQYHSEKFDLFDTESFLKNIKYISKFISKYSKKQKYKWYRPHMGLFTDKTIKLLKKNKFDGIVLSNVYPFDVIIKNIQINTLYLKLKLSNGCIMLLHDLKSTSYTLDKIIPYVKNLNYKIVNFSELYRIKN